MDARRLKGWRAGSGSSGSGSGPGQKKKGEEGSGKERRETTDRRL